MSPEYKPIALYNNFYRNEDVGFRFFTSCPQKKQKKDLYTDTIQTSKRQENTVQLGIKSRGLTDRLPSRIKSTVFCNVSRVPLTFREA
jgi:hypothetical protein